MKKKIKIIILTIFIFGFFLVFNSGFRFDSWELLFQIFVFTLLTMFLIFQPGLKKGFVLSSLVLFIFMVIFFILDYTGIANFFGSLGFGILIISSLFYLPKLLKYGYV